MKQHKWHKEIKAWADGAEIQKRVYGLEGVWSDWYDSELFEWEDDLTEYRIKPQPKEPQYLYAFHTPQGLVIRNSKVFSNDNDEIIGKIKLETEDGN